MYNTWCMLIRYFYCRLLYYTICRVLIKDTFEILLFITWWYAHMLYRLFSSDSAGIPYSILITVPYYQPECQYLLQPYICPLCFHIFLLLCMTRSLPLCHTLSFRNPTAASAADYPIYNTFIYSCYVFIVLYFHVWPCYYPYGKPSCHSLLSVIRVLILLW